MNCIYLDGHTYTPDDLRALVADRDQWQAEAERLRAENAQLRKEAVDSHAAIVMLVTENAKEATPEALLALGEAMDNDATTNDDLARIAAETAAPAWWECSHGHRTENAKPFCETCGEHWKHIHDEGQWEQEQMQPWRRQ